MKCKDIKHLLYLKDHELSENEKKLVNDHLKECTSCSKEFESIHKIWEKTYVLRQQPQIANPDELTSDILDKINQRHAGHKLKWFITSSLVRRTLSTAAFLLLGLFVYQQIEIIQKLDELDAQVQTHTSAQNNKPSSTEKSLIKHLPKQQIIELMGTSDLERLMTDYKTLLDENQDIYQYLQKNHPEIYKEIKDEIHNQNQSHENDL